MNTGEIYCPACEAYRDTDKSLDLASENLDKLLYCVERMDVEECTYDSYDRLVKLINKLENVQSKVTRKQRKLRDEKFYYY